MSIEEQLAELTAAVKENTEAHRAFAEVAKAAQGGRSTKAAPAKAAPAKAAEAPAEEKPAPKSRSRGKASKPKAPEVKGSVSRADFKKVGRTFLSDGDEEVQEANTEKFAAALQHLGAESLSGVDDDDLAKLDGYIAYWNAGLEVDFEEIDALVEAAAEKAGGGSDDMLD